MAFLPIMLSFGALALNAATLLIGYGVLKGTVSALDKRVLALEAEIGALTAVRVNIGEIKTAISYMTTQIDAIASATLSGAPRRQPKGGL